MNILINTPFQSNIFFKIHNFTLFDPKPQELLYELRGIKFRAEISLVTTRPGESSARWNTIVYPVK